MILNICQVVPYVSPRFGGPPRTVSANVETLMKYGIDVETITTVASGENEERKKEGLFKESDKNGKLHRLPRVWPKKWFNAESLKRCLDERISLSDICHLQMFWEKTTLDGSKCAINHNVPYIVTPRGVLEPWRVAHKGTKKRLYLKLFGNNIIKNAACLHALSDHEIAGFRAVGYDGPVCVIPNGVDRKVLELGRNTAGRQEDSGRWDEYQGKRVVLFMSRLEPEKGLDNLIKAWSIIHSKYPETVILIAGPNNRGYGLIVQEMVNEYGLSQTMKFVGPIYGEDKTALLNRADIFTLPSYSEGFSMAILEALAMGLPCLITPGCNFPEASNSGAAVEAEPTSESVAESLTHMLNMTDEQLKIMGQKGQSLVERDYTWDVIVKKLINVYRCIVEKRDIPLHPEPIDDDFLSGLSE